MKRVEIISNKAIEEEIIAVLGIVGHKEAFTLLSPVFGRGRKGRREGSAVWPEQNSLFIVHIEDEKIEALQVALKKVKENFSVENLRCYICCDSTRMV
ncbi:hypothetical protein JW935_08785 [candidate division KSB1 bacterium]|nr:hypothetical protein [candidate division KSB1 bacterium]